MKEEDSELMDMGDHLFDFTLAENLEMENLFKEMKEKSTSQEFCEELADKFSHSVHRSDKSPVAWEQVQSWFQDKQANSESNVTRSSQLGAMFEFSKAALVKSRDKVSTIPASEAALELPNLIFEARSAKDYAWFDVACFLNYKVLYSGELMVRVRFAGFDKEEDEWVSVRTAVRERSIPLVSSECDTINVGDLVLCYRVDPSLLTFISLSRWAFFKDVGFGSCVQANEDHALYSDACVTEIERKIHDSESCTCVFGVCFEYDKTEEKVELLRLCRRPKKSLSSEIMDLSLV